MISKAQTRNKVSLRVILMIILGLCFEECSIADKPMFIFVLGCGAILERQASHQVNRCAAAAFLGLSIIHCKQSSLLTTNLISLSSLDQIFEDFDQRIWSGSSAILETVFRCPYRRQRQAGKIYQLL